MEKDTMVMVESEECVSRKEMEAWAWCKHQERIGEPLEIMMLIHHSFFLFGFELEGGSRSSLSVLPCFEPHKERAIECCEKTKTQQYNI